MEEQKLSAAASSAPSAMAVWCIPSLSDDGVQEAIEREAPRLPQVLNPATRLLMYCKNVDAMSRGE